jgi:hypothetical protein
MLTKSAEAKCCSAGCPSRAKSYGRCLPHYWQLKREHPEEIVRLKSLTTTEREREFYKLTHPPSQKWTYEGREQELIDANEELEKSHGI